jgi:glucose 1-dehydrogenase
VQADISREEEDVQHLVQEVVEKLGDLDILINNAGIQFAADSHEMLVADFDHVLAVNLRGAFVAAQVDIRHFPDEEKYAYNPSCHSNQRWVCPLSPLQNRLDFPTSVGEMSWQN